MMSILAEQCQVGAGCSSDAWEPTHYVVRGLLAHILRISSFFGLAPLRFVPHDNGYTITLSKPMRLYSYILNTFLVSCSLSIFVIQIARSEEPAINQIPRVQGMIILCKVLLIYINTSIGVCGAPKRMKKILRLIDSMALVDKNIGQQHSVKIEQKVCAVVFVILLMSFTIIVSDFCALMSDIKKSDITFWITASNHISLCMLKLVMIILELQFAVTALFVQVRLRAVNNAIVVITNNNLDDSPALLSPHESVRRLATSYGTLCDAVQLVNDSYGWSLIGLVVAILVDHVVTLYFFIVDILTSSIRVKIYVIQSLWCVVYVLRILIIVEPCYNTVNEKNKTGRLVCHLMTVAPPTGLLAARLQLFSKQLMLWSVSYTPLSLFTLDRTLLTAVIGAITTYLVILIQFSNS